MSIHPNSKKHWLHECYTKLKVLEQIFFSEWEKFIQASSTYFYRYDLPTIKDQKIEKAYKL